MIFTKYEYIYNELRKELEVGTYCVDSEFPSLSELSKRFSASRATICKAVKLLEDQDLISAKHGVGTKVIDQQKVTEQKFARLEIALDFSDDKNSLLSDYKLSILQGITRASEKYNFLIRILKPDDIRNWSTLSKLPDGLILSPKTNAELLAELHEVTTHSQLPIVLLNRTAPAYDVGEIRVDYRKTTSQVISKYIKEGYTRIAIFYNKNHAEILQERVQGWRDAYIENGLEVPEELIISTHKQRNLMVRLDEIFTREMPQLFFSCDILCFQSLYVALIKKHILVPEQTKMLCFDNIDFWLDLFDIEASYISMPAEQMGFLAAENIYQRLVDPMNTLPIKKEINASLIK